MIEQILRTFVSALFTISACNATLEPIIAEAQEAYKAHRVVVLTDIEADPDDTQSLNRLLLYSNEIEIAGLVATTSVHQKDRIAPEAILAVVDKYGVIFETLSQHAQGYPRAEALAALIQDGQPSYGLASVGDSQDTAGSDLIISLLDDSDPRPVWVSVWGGANTLAQALHTIRSTRPADEARRLIDKLRVYAISDQDDSGAWIRREFPNLFYIVSPGGYDNSTWIAITKPFPGSEEEISAKWLAENIQYGHGPLGAHYPDVIYGMEGDTPSFLSLIPNGLNAPEHPDWGGWGGRYELYKPAPGTIDKNSYAAGVVIGDETRPIWTNAKDHFVSETGAEFHDHRVTLWRWRKDFQNDFAARMDWTVKPYEGANHPPAIALSSPARFAVRGGDRFVLDATASTDPDGDALKYVWFNYPEAGSLSEAIGEPVAAGRASFVAPAVIEPATAHFILRVTDDGTPQLSSYARIIVNITP